MKTKLFFCSILLFIGVTAFAQKSGKTHGKMKDAFKSLYKIYNEKELTTAVKTKTIITAKKKLNENDVLVIKDSLIILSHLCDYMIYYLEGKPDSACIALVNSKKELHKINSYSPAIQKQIYNDYRIYLGHRIGKYFFFRNLSNTINYFTGSIQYEQIDCIDVRTGGTDYIKIHDTTLIQCPHEIKELTKEVQEIKNDQKKILELLNMTNNKTLSGFLNSDSADSKPITPKEIVDILNKLDFNDKDYISRKLPQINELVQHQKGDYWIVTFTNKTISPTGIEKIDSIKFEEGKYTINAFNNIFLNSINAFMQDVKRLKTGGRNVAIYIIGSASKTPCGNCIIDDGYKFHNQIKYHSKVPGATLCYKPDFEIINITNNNLVNEQLPNLRAAFVQYCFKNSWGQVSEILDGTVQNSLSPSSQKATMILCLPKEN